MGTSAAVLVTRPAGQAQGLLAALAEADINAVHQPLLELQGLEELPAPQRQYVIDLELYQLIGFPQIRQHLDDHEVTIDDDDIAAQLRRVSVTTPIVENEFVVLSGTIFDPEPLETFTLTVSWNVLGPAGSDVFLFGDFPIDTETLRWDPVTGEFEIEHQYLDDKPSGTSADEVGSFRLNSRWTSAASMPSLRATSSTVGRRLSCCSSSREARR